MRDFLSKISITTFSVVYLFSCGAIYLISFWSTFDFDITNYIDLLDIPKSFIYPLATGVGITLFSVLIQGITGFEESMLKIEKKDTELLPQIKEMPNKALLRRIFGSYSVWTVIILFVCLIFYKPRREWVFAISTLCIVIYSAATFLRLKTVIILFPNWLTRFLVSIVLIVIPPISFMIGKSNAIKIWNNETYFITTGVILKEGPTDHGILAQKLLGKLGGYIFLSDTLNGHITVLNLEEVVSIKYKLCQSRR